MYPFPPRFPSGKRAAAAAGGGGEAGERLDRGEERGGRRGALDAAQAAVALLERAVQVAPELLEAAEERRGAAEGGRVFRGEVAREGGDRLARRRRRALDFGGEAGAGAEAAADHDSGERREPREDARRGGGRVDVAVVDDGRAQERQDRGESVEVGLAAVHLHAGARVDEHAPQREGVEQVRARGERVRRPVAEPDLDREAAGHRLAARFEHAREGVRVLRESRAASLARDELPRAAAIEVHPVEAEAAQDASRGAQRGGVATDDLRDGRERSAERRGGVGEDPLRDLLRRAERGEGREGGVDASEALREQAAERRERDAAQRGEPDRRRGHRGGGGEGGAAA